MSRPSKIPSPSCSFTMEEFLKANDEWGCNCGPGALAAMLGLKPDEVLPHIPGFKERRYTNPTMMMTALRSLKVSFRELDDAPDREQAERGEKSSRVPDYGLVRVQWEGRWLNPGVPPAAAYKYTHWIGTFRNTAANWREQAIWIFDINVGWVSQPQWSLTTARQLALENKGATGDFHFTHRWELFV